MQTLTGSEKQIAWASQIRAKAEAWLNETKDYVADDAEFYGADDPAIIEQIAIIEKLESLFNRDDATFWIDNRDEMPFDIANPRVADYKLRRFGLEN